LTFAPLGVEGLRHTPSIPFVGIVSLAIILKWGGVPKAFYLLIAEKYLNMKSIDTLDTMVDRKSITSLTARTDLLVLKSLTQ
jgi:hypothetical protein